MNMPDEMFERMAQHELGLEGMTCDLAAENGLCDMYPAKGCMACCQACGQDVCSPLLEYMQLAEGEHEGASRQRATKSLAACESHNTQISEELSVCLATIPPHRGSDMRHHIVRA